MLKINQLSEQTGLKETFIRKCLNRLNPILEPYLSRGENNSWIFKSSALEIFRRIKELKEDDMTLPEIEKKLKKDLEPGGKSVQTRQSNRVKPVGKPDKPRAGERTDPDLLKDLLQKNTELAVKLSQEKDARRQDQQQAADEILKLTKEKERADSGLKLLTDGKPPEQVKAEKTEAQKRVRERIKIVSDLKHTGTIRVFKRKKLLKKLDELIWKYDP